MQQRRLRLGDILDDYCPRERRITNHAVVAMIEDEVRQTRCTTCDADHDYKQAKVPTSRRKKPGELLPPSSDLLDLPPAPSLTAPLPAPVPSEVFASPVVLDDDAVDVVEAELSDTDADLESDAEPVLNDDGPVHRRLIRATLPRPEGQTPERKAPDFTIRQPGGGRFDQQRSNNNNSSSNSNGQPRHRGRPPGRPPQGQPNGQNGQPTRFGGPRQGAGQGGAANGQRQGNRPGNAPGQRGSRPAGPNRGPRQGGQGRKRGR